MKAKAQHTHEEQQRLQMELAQMEMKRAQLLKEEPNVAAELQQNSRNADGISNNETYKGMLRRRQLLLVSLPAIPCMYDMYGLLIRPCNCGNKD